MAVIRPARADDEAALLTLNNVHAAETSSLDAERLHAMLGMAFMAAVAEDRAAMLIAFDQDAAYGSVNFLWFGERLARFVYVDRIITAPAARGRGLARALYEALFAQARSAGHDRVVCEVNLQPPNPVSDRFHEALGFAEIGQAELAAGGKRVRYLSRLLPS